MFVAFMPLHILLCDDMLLYFILCIGVIQFGTLEFESKRFKFVNRFIKFKSFSLFYLANGPKPTFTLCRPNQPKPFPTVPHEARPARWPNSVAEPVWR
jgi:hypothetical protein